MNQSNLNNLSFNQATLAAPIEQLKQTLKETNVNKETLLKEFKDTHIGTLDALQMYKPYKELRTAIFSIIGELTKKYKYVLSDHMVRCVCNGIRALSGIMTTRDNLEKIMYVNAFIAEVHVLRDFCDFLMNTPDVPIANRKIFKMFEIICEIETQCSSFKTWLEKQEENCKISKN